MADGPMIAAVAALIGDPARANMLTALMDGRARTVSELAGAAGVALPTASGHLAKLDAAGLLAARRQGRHRYFRLSGHDVASVLEMLMALSDRPAVARPRAGPAGQALRVARTCYDHLAGERGVGLLDRLLDQAWLAGTPAIVTPVGQARLFALGIDVAALARGRRPLCPKCLDWSERRDHLGGALGAAILDLVVRRAWVRRGPGRLVTFTQAGARGFDAAFGPAVTCAAVLADRVASAALPG